MSQLIGEYYLIEVCCFRLCRKARSLGQNAAVCRFSTVPEIAEAEYVPLGSLVLWHPRRNKRRFGRFCGQTSGGRRRLVDNQDLMGFGWCCGWRPTAVSGSNCLRWATPLRAPRTATAEWKKPGRDQTSHCEKFYKSHEHNELRQKAAGGD